MTKAKLHAEQRIRRITIDANRAFGKRLLHRHQWIRYERGTILKCADCGKVKEVSNVL